MTTPRHSGTLVTTSVLSYRLEPYREPINWKIPVSYTIKQLIYAVNFAKQHPNDTFTPAVYGADTLTAQEYIRWFRKALYAKINRNEKSRGRKDCPDWFMMMWRTSREVNQPRLIVRWVPLEIRHRLERRIETEL